LGQTLNDSTKNVLQNDVRESIKTLRSFRGFYKRPENENLTTLSIKEQCFQSINVIDAAAQENHRHSWNIAESPQEMYDAVIQIFDNERAKKESKVTTKTKKKTGHGITASVAQTSRSPDFASKQLKSLFSKECAGERQQEHMLDILQKVCESCIHS
jgi:hypothetical protein